MVKRYGGRLQNGGPPNVNTKVSGRAGKRVARQEMAVNRGAQRDREWKKQIGPDLDSVAKWWRASPPRDAGTTVLITDDMLRDAWAALDAVGPSPYVAPRPRLLRDHTGYLERAFEEPEQLEAAARERLAKVDFDTMIGRGLSGTLVIPWLARAMGKHWAIVRKPGESSHSTRRVEGVIGQRWIFVDDFISSGQTRRETRAAIELHCTHHAHQTAYVGTYSYQDHTSDDGGRFEDAP